MTDVPSTGWQGVYRWLSCRLPGENEEGKERKEGS